MKFVVSGANKTTGARMTLEFEADSKAQAQRKAESAGMYVHTARPADDSVGPPVKATKPGLSRLIVPLIPLIVIAVIIYLSWGWIHSFIARH